MRQVIEVEGITVEQARAIAVAMGDPVARAQAIVLGLLMQLSDDRARRRVLTYIVDKFDLSVEVRG